MTMYICSTDTDYIYKSVFISCYWCLSEISIETTCISPSPDNKVQSGRW